jgi:hypothetical protein
VRHQHIWWVEKEIRSGWEGRKGGVIDKWFQRNVQQKSRSPIDYTPAVNGVAQVFGNTFFFGELLLVVECGRGGEVANFAKMVMAKPTCMSGWQWQRIVPQTVKKCPTWQSAILPLPEEWIKSDY